ncbi:4350_t:CDS:2, partial [Rhizophagus irregularis]
HLELYNWPTDEEWELLTELANLLALFASITKGENYILQEQINEMIRVSINYFDELNEALHVPAFFDLQYKKLSYGIMNRYEILQPI